MLTIRLARTGRKKLAHYRVVAADSRRATTGKFVAQLGHYNPHNKELVLDDELMQQYLDNGAQPSSRMVKILEGYKGVKLPEWTKKNLVVKAEKPKEEPEAEAKPEAATADTASEAETTEEVPEKEASEEAAPEEAAEEKAEETAEKSEK